MSFCSNVFNYSEFISAIDWNRTRSPPSTAQLTSNIADLNNANQNIIFNIVRTLTNEKYIISLFILMAVILKFRLTSLKQQYQHRKDALLRILVNLSCFGVFVVLLPILLTAWLCVLSYRRYIHFLIRKKYGDRFRGFLEGTDAVWALEDDTARSVINVMALVEIGAENKDSGPVNVLLALRKRFAARFLSGHNQFPKLFYKRCKAYGYSFWTNENESLIEEHIRFIPSDQLGSDNESYIETTFGALSNTPLPCNHTASWEILVSKGCMNDPSHEDYDIDVARIPILFRIHHALGDGVALLRLFLETIADKEPPRKYLWAHCVRVRQELKKYLEINTKSPIDEAKHFDINFWRSIPSFDMDKIKSLFQRLKAGVLDFGQKTWIFVSSPASMVHQAFRAIDENSLHKQKLSGEKLVCWYFENEDEHHLLDTIKSIKRNFQGVRFSDVLLSAVSISFQNFFEKKGKHIPNEMTVVLPARIEVEGAKLKLQNKFSVALQTLPIQAEYSLKKKSKAGRFHAKMFEVKKYADQVHNSSDYMVNYWIMSFLTPLLPENIFASIAESVHSTIAISNLPGPQVVTYINGYRISNLTFWLPHRGSTGIGMSILSYGYRLQLGLIADRAVIDNQADAQSILDNMVEEIRYMATRRNYNLKRNSVGDIIDRF